MCVCVKMAQYTGRHWSLTVNAPKGSTEDEALTDLLPTWERLHENFCSYTIFKGEMGEGGGYHIQGHIEFAKPITQNEVKELIGHKSKKGKYDTCVLKVHKNCAASINYIKKQVTTWEALPLIEKDRRGNVKKCNIQTWWLPEHRAKCIECAREWKKEIDDWFDRWEYTEWGDYM